MKAKHRVLAAGMAAAMTCPWLRVVVLLLPQSLRLVLP